MQSKAGRGYMEARGLAADESPECWERIVELSTKKLSDVFNGIEYPEHGPTRTVVQIGLSKDLYQWRSDQHKTGRVLPSRKRWAQSH